MPSIPFDLIVAGLCLLGMGVGIGYLTFLPEIAKVEVKHSNLKERYLYAQIQIAGLQSDNAKLQAEVAAWQDHYNQTHLAEMDLRSKLLDLPERLV